VPHLPPVLHKAIKPDGQQNTLLVILRGRWLEAYVNQAAVCDPILLEQEIISAGIGLTASGAGKGSVAEFTHVTVWPAVNLPTPDQRGAKPKD
jgi:hypothetical protein